MQTAMYAQNNTTEINVIIKFLRLILELTSATSHPKMQEQYSDGIGDDAQRGNRLKHDIHHTGRQHDHQLVQIVDQQQGHHTAQKNVGRRHRHGEQHLIVLGLMQLALCHENTSHKADGKRKDTGQGKVQPIHAQSAERFTHHEKDGAEQHPQNPYDINN